MSTEQIAKLIKAHELISEVRRELPAAEAFFDGERFILSSIGTAGYWLDFCVVNLDRALSDGGSKKLK